mgnify:CR=1 FL=1
MIPDIHADLERLEATLSRTPETGNLLFLGDLIDAGTLVASPDDKAVLRRVRQLVEEGRARCVMGNHELNAILYHTDGPEGPLRQHSPKNATQHRSFISAFGTGTREAREWTDWLLSLPLWLQVAGLCLLHACWDEDAVETVRARRPDARLKRSDLAEVANECTEFGRAVKRLLNGPEVRLPSGYSFEDFGGHTRQNVRLAWWRSNARNWREAALSVPDVTQLPDARLPPTERADLYPQGALPVLVGHYKMDGAPCIEAPNAACLDYPLSPCAYRWSGEPNLFSDGIIKV